MSDETHSRPDQAEEPADDIGASNVDSDEARHGAGHTSPAAPEPGHEPAGDVPVRDVGGAPTPGVPAGPSDVPVPGAPTTAPGVVPTPGVSAGSPAPARPAGGRGLGLPRPLADPAAPVAEPVVPVAPAADRVVPVVPVIDPVTSLAPGGSARAGVGADALVGAPQAPDHGQGSVALADPGARLEPHGSHALVDDHAPVDDHVDHDDHDDHPVDHPAWVLAPLLVGLVLGLIVVVLLGLQADANPFHQIG